MPLSPPIEVKPADLADSIIAKFEKALTEKELRDAERRAEREEREAQRREEREEREAQRRFEREEREAMRMAEYRELQLLLNAVGKSQEM